MAAVFFAADVAADDDCRALACFAAVLLAFAVPAFALVTGFLAGLGFALGFAAFADVFPALRADSVLVFFNAFFNLALVLAGTLAVALAVAFALALPGVLVFADLAFAVLAFFVLDLAVWAFLVSVFVLALALVSVFVLALAFVLAFVLGFVV